MTEHLRKVGYPAITLLGLAYAFYRGYLFPLPDRLSSFNAWQTGDWLINYSGGVVRRGFIGEILITLAPNAAHLTATVALIQLGLAATLFVLVGILYLRTDRGPVWMMVVLSPAFLLFPALDSDGNARKELLVFVALAIVAIGISTHKRVLAGWVAFPLFALGALSHEALILTLPAFIVLLVVGAGNLRDSWAMRTLVAAYAVAAGLGLLLAVIAQGNQETVQAICTSWQDVGINDCSGALGALNESATSMRHTLLGYFPSYWNYLLPAALATLPFFALRLLPTHWWVGLLVAVSLAPLFLVAWDYGRWIFLWTAQMSLIALAWSRTSRVAPMRVSAVGALAFILLWGFNHAGEPLNEGLGIRWLSSILN